MRLFPLISVVLSVCATVTAAHADTFFADSDVTHVKLHPQTAVVRREAKVQLPAGQHQILISGLPLDIDATSLILDHPGLDRLSVSLRDDYPLQVPLISPEQEAAKARVEELELRIAELKQAAALARTSTLAGQVKIDFLSQIGQRDGIGNLSVAQLQDLSDMISVQTQTAKADILAADVQAQDIERGLPALNKDLEKARATLQALSLQSEDRMFVALNVVASQAVDTTVELSYLVKHQTRWTPAYDLRLDSANKTLTFERSVFVSQNTGEDWNDVVLTLATASPSTQSAPSVLHPRQARIHDPATLALKTRQQLGRSVAADAVLATPVIEPEIASSYSVSEAGVTYLIPQQVSVATDGGTVQLGLPSIVVPAEVSAQVVPLWDSNAYRMVEITNTSDQELLSSAQTRFYIGTELVGTGGFQGLVANATTKMGFGAIEGLQVKRAILGRSDGEQGVISRSNQRVTQVAITVENLTDRDWPVRVLEGVPYSEQDDLEVSWQATPLVSVENVDNQRGILAWDLQIGTGLVQNIALKTQIDWPEGYVLSE